MNMKDVTQRVSFKAGYGMCVCVRASLSSPEIENFIRPLVFVCLDILFEILYLSFSVCFFLFISLTQVEATLSLYYTL